jgi:hypothetical protein
LLTSKRIKNIKRIIAFQSEPKIRAADGVPSRHC